MGLSLAEQKPPVPVRVREEVGADSGSQRREHSKPRRFGGDGWMHRARSSMLTTCVQMCRQHSWPVRMAILLMHALCGESYRNRKRKYSSIGFSHFLACECPRQVPYRTESFNFVPEEIQIRLGRTFQARRQVCAKCILHGLRTFWNRDEKLLTT